MAIHEKIVHQRSDLTVGKCAPTLEYGVTITAGAVPWELGNAVKIMDANTASTNFIATDVIIECDLSIWLGDEGED